MNLFWPALKRRQFRRALTVKKYLTRNGPPRKQYWFYINLMTYHSIKQSRTVRVSLTFTLPNAFAWCCPEFGVLASALKSRQNIPWFQGEKRKQQRYDNAYLLSAYRSMSQPLKARTNSKAIGAVTQTGARCVAPASFQTDMINSPRRDLKNRP